MSGKRHGRLARVTALVPLAVLSAAWTVNVTGLGGTASASSTTPASDARGTLPDGTPLPPPIGLNHPATVSAPQAQQISPAQAAHLIDNATVSGIPAAALAAYQRAATVINAAETSCHLPWQLVGAIGRVESDHGRADGNHLNSRGIAVPGIFGPVLNGKNGTARIADTDGGALDGDTSYDRAVGPMQFIPSTWSMVAVDADGDGQRNPQDINDAALATAVYLCSGSENLNTPAGAKQAVYRYNHSWTYVDTVLAVEKAYLAGDYAAVPTGSTDTGPVGGGGLSPSTVMRSHPIHRSTSSTPSGGFRAPSAPTTTTTAPHTTSKPHTAASQPAAPKATKTTAPSTPSTTAPPVTTNPVAPVLATTTELTKVCTQALTSKGVSGSALNTGVTACVKQLQGKTLKEAESDVSSVVSGLLGSLLGGIGGLLGG